MRIWSLLLCLCSASLFIGAAFPGKADGPGHEAERIFQRAKAEDFKGDEYCAACHEDKVANFAGSPHAACMSSDKLPLGKRGCEGCHGAGGVHQDENNPEVVSFRSMTPKESSAACLRCHESTMSASHWKNSAHAKADLACVTCHKIHPDSEPQWADSSFKRGKADDLKKPLFTAAAATKSLLMADEPTLCGQCHTSEIAQFRMNSHHPVPEGQVVCSDCHTVHPSKESKSRFNGVNDKCVTCHTEYAGPFVYQHDPVAGNSGDGCLECHKAHGSANPRLLNTFSRGLCAQCHTEKLSTHHPGQSCWNTGCHVAPHGSNTDPYFLKP